MHLQSMSVVKEHPHIRVISIDGAQYVEADSSVLQQEVRLAQQIQTQIFYKIQANRPAVNCSGDTQCIQQNRPENVQRFWPVLKKIVHNLHLSYLCIQPEGQINLICL